MDLSAPRMQLMTPRLSVTGIDDALHLLEGPASLRRANEAAIEFMQSHRMAVNWGDLGDCPANAMSLEPLASRSVKLRRNPNEPVIHIVRVKVASCDRPPLIEA